MLQLSANHDEQSNAFGGNVSIGASAQAPRADHRRGSSAWLALVGWIVLAAIAGAVGGIASVNSREFYAMLVKPGWGPPGWLFGPVWSVLYLLMGVAAWLVWRERPAGPLESNAQTYGLQLFVLQLVFNALWTWLFFAWRLGALAFMEIVVLWIMIAMTIWQFARVRQWVAWLMVPYIVWVTFAAALTWAIWHGNPALL